MEVAVDGKFPCPGCGKLFTWKAEIAGRGAKCKCGAAVKVPAERPVAPKPEDDDLYGLEPMDDLPAISFAKPATPVAETHSHRRTTTASSAMAVPGANPLSYQRGQTAREKQLGSRDTFIDMKRDVYAPSAIAVLGLVMYLVYYATHYNLKSTGEVLGVMLGVSILTAFKTILLVGFALVAAGPLGVSFGGLWTAILKLAAIAVFSDGVATWVDAGMIKLAGGFGQGFISFPITLGVYWLLLISLFSMDAGESWLTVMVLAVFDQIVRVVLLMLLLSLVMKLGGVSVPASAVPGYSAPPPTSEQQQIQELKDRKLLPEAREWVKGGRQIALGPTIDGFYAAGAPNVYFELELDVARKGNAAVLVVELPDDPAKRAEIVKVLRQHYTNMQWDPADAEAPDPDDEFLWVPIR